MLLRCKTCSQEKLASAEFFRADSRQRSGYRSTCKACVSAAKTLRSQNDPESRERLRAAERKWYEQNRAKKIAKDGARHRAKRQDPATAEKMAAARRLRHRSRMQREGYAETRRNRLRASEVIRLLDPEKRSKKLAAAVDRRARSTELIEQHRRRASQWQKENPDKVRARFHRRRAREKGASGVFTGDDLERICVGQDWRCYWCHAGIDRSMRHADHYVPLSRGGSNAPDNIVASCSTCNCRKGAKMPDEFREYLKRAASK